MHNEKSSTNKQLVEPTKKLVTAIDSKEVTLEELESLCYTFDVRPRGCNNFDATDESDELLF